MSEANVISRSPPAHDDELPPLRIGDRLLREEFYRRWDAMPGLKHAERLGRVVSMAASVLCKHHGRPHSHVVMWIGQYEAKTPGVEGGDNSTLQFGPDDDAQADAYLLVLPECGGHCRFTDDDYLEGGPELVVEVSSSSVPRDLKKKLPLYRENGVREYVVWKTTERFCGFGEWMGSLWRRRRMRMSFFAARSSRACGSTRLH